MNLKKAVEMRGEGKDGVGCTCPKCGLNIQLKSGTVCHEKRCPQCNTRMEEELLKEKKYGA